MDSRIVAGSVLGVGILIGGAVLAARMGGDRPSDSLDAVSDTQSEGIRRAGDIEPGGAPAPESVAVAAGPSVSVQDEKGPLGLSFGGEAGQRRFETEFSENLDLDGDGTISDEEREAAHERFRAEREARRQQWLLEQYDKDGDGVLSETELAQQEADRQDREKRRAERAAERLEKALAAYDADGDGTLSEEEKKAGRDARRAYMSGQQEAMKALFADEQASDRTEFDPGGISDAADRFFTQMSLVRNLDFDGDSAITPADMPAFMDLFATGDRRADVDHNGIVDAADLARFHQQTLEPVDPRLAEAVAWFNNAPPPVDAGFANVMMFSDGGNVMVGDLSGGSFVIDGGEATFTFDGILPEIGDDSSAVVIIQTVEEAPDGGE